MKLMTCQIGPKGLDVVGLLLLNAAQIVPPPLLPPDFWSGGPSGPVGWLAGPAAIKSG